MKDTDERKLEQNIKVKGGEIKAKVTIGGPAGAMTIIKEYVQKAHGLLDWMKAPEQTQLDFSGATVFQDCRIRVDKPTKTGKNISLGLSIECKSEADRQGWREIFAFQEAGRKIDLRIVPVPKKPAPKKKSTSPAKRATEKRPEAK